MPGASLIEICTRLARHAAFDEVRELEAALSELGRMAASSSSLPPAGLLADASTTLRYHHVAPVILAAINQGHLRSAIDPGVLAAVERAVVRQPTEAVLLRTFDEMQQALRRAEIDAVLLKGLQFAHRLYGGYHRRPQYDLDVLVRAGDRPRARRVLVGLGYRRDGYDLHSETFVRDAGGTGADEIDASKADIHGWLRRAPAYRIAESAVWRDVRPVRLGEVEVLTLSDEYTLVLLGLSCFEDLGQGMAKIKQLLDTLLFLRDVDRSMDWETFFGLRAAERIDAILAHVFALVVMLFGAEHEVPRLEAALAARGDGGVCASRQMALALISAPRKHAANFSWFARVYPGSIWLYLAWFWTTGFPGNAKELQAARLLRTLAAARTGEV